MTSTKPFRPEVTSGQLPTNGDYVCAGRSAHRYPHFPLIGAVLTLAAVIQGCSSTGMGSTTLMRTGSPQDERACLTAVARQTNNTVSVISSEFSQANTLVMVGVGPSRAPWRCLVSGGRVAEVSFDGSEGFL